MRRRECECGNDTFHVETERRAFTRARVEAVCANCGNVIHIS